MPRHLEWINRAKGSLEMAQIKINGHIQYEDLCFQAQQAAEKALKGLRIYYGVEPEFTHNIEKLLPVENTMKNPALKGQPILFR